jgi:NAD(P)-dependent dehydrogenase (short-subunit alcohol dehydrogenase family)
MAKTALVTGGASGIGEALARALAERGVIVILADRQIDEARQVCASIAQSGGRARAEELDVRDADRFEEIARGVFEREGRLDYFFNNAGIGIGGRARDMSRADWDEIIDVNLRGVVNGIQAVYPRMIEQGSGHIINTASAAGLGPTPMSVAYSTTKHAVVGLSQSLRAEAALEGIRVSALCPGVIRTPILEGGRYGRIIGFDANKLLGLWELLRPMDVTRFARKVIKQVERNRGIIVVPTWWKISWVLGRVSPEVSVRMARAACQRALSEMNRG